MAKKLKMGFYTTAFFKTPSRGGSVGSLCCNIELFCMESKQIVSIRSKLVYYVSILIHDLCTIPCSAENTKASPVTRVLPRIPDYCSRFVK